MIRNKHKHIGYLLAGAAVVAANIGCGVASAGVGSPAVSPATAALSLGPLSEVACTVEGAPRVIAYKVAPSVGVQAQADLSHVWLRVAHQGANSSLSFAVDPESMNVVAESEMSARGPNDAPKGSAVAEIEAAAAGLDSALPTLDVERVESDRLPSGGETARVIVEQSRAAARVDAERTVVARTVGSVYTGLDVQVSTLGRAGRALGAPVLIANGGSVLGEPVVAFTPSGRGVVAYLESSEHGFQLVAASLACGGIAPAADPPPSWAMQTP
jgi:hypothetical protein